VARTVVHLRRSGSGRAPRGRRDMRCRMRSRFGAASNSPSSLAKKRFEAKWRPVRARKTRQIKNPGSSFDSIETETALDRTAARERSSDHQTGIVAEMFGESKVALDANSGRQARLAIPSMNRSRITSARRSASASAPPQRAVIRAIRLGKCRNGAPGETPVMPGASARDVWR